MLVVPLQATPSQVVTVTLARQPCRINVYQKRTGLFVDLYVSGEPVITGVKALQGNLIVRDSYLGFAGDLAFFDVQGEEDPHYTGLGGRFVLMFVEPA